MRRDRLDDYLTSMVAYIIAESSFSINRMRLAAREAAQVNQFTL
jgi:hypothetical protein